MGPYDKHTVAMTPPPWWNTVNNSEKCGIEFLKPFLKSQDLGLVIGKVTKLFAELHRKIAFGESLSKIYYLYEFSFLDKQQNILIGVILCGWA